MTIKRNLIQIIVFFRMYKQWKKLACQVKTLVYNKPSDPCLVIVPCDPWTVGGSRGDEAMITGIIQYYRNLFPHIPIHMICSDDNGVSFIKRISEYNITPIVSWNGTYPLARIYNSIMEVKPTDVVILGADCMDGFYSPELSLSLLAIHDLCTKTAGVNSRLLGFSFNNKPNRMVVRAFRSLTSDVRIGLRDAVSLSRFRQYVHREALLVADAAFMLEPRIDFPLFAVINSWIKEQRQKERIVIGVNFHPMLRVYRGADDIKDDAILLARNLERILQMHENICFVFVPHDDRSRLTDNLMLSTMYESLQEYKERIFYSAEVPRASQLKAVCGLLDALVSSRMHLAIAALGMEIPVMAATYQGKFEGLFKHFGLKERFLLTPQKFLSDDMIQAFNIFLESIPDLKKQIRKKLPQVIELSRNNIRDE